MKRALKLAKNLLLPLEAITQTFAILAKRGVGKTYTAAVMAEQMLKAGKQVVIVDPLGVWWGLRANADGKREGLPIVIFGGDHADVPLESTAGEVIADLIVNNHLSAVLDLSRFRKAEQNRFMTAFAEKLYHRNRAPLHLMLDEADSFAPQRPQRGEERMLGALEDVVRRGRARGLGVTFISQRSAVLNKNVLTQAEVLIALRTIAPQDRDAIDAWIDIHGDKDKRKEMMASLASLDVGEAWFWSPGWLETFKRIKVNRRETFDSSATPKVGMRMRKPKKLAAVDLEKIKTKIVDTIERAKQDDPRELRKQVAELQQQLKEKPEPQKVVEKKVGRPKLEVRTVHVLGKRQMQKLNKLTMLLHDVATAMARAIRPIADALDRFDPAKNRVPLPNEKPAPPPPAMPVRQVDVTVRRGAARQQDEGQPVLRKGERNMLRTLFQVHPTVLTRAQLGTLAGYSVNGGSFDTYIGTLRRCDYIIEQGDTIGVNMSKAPSEFNDARPLTRDNVLEMWSRRLRKGERAMLEVLLANPKGLTKEELGEKSGYTVEGGSFDTYVGTLTRNGLAEKDRGVIKISETLFLGAVK